MDWDKSINRHFKSKKQLSLSTLLEQIEEITETNLGLLKEETLGNKLEQAIVDAALGKDGIYDKDVFKLSKSDPQGVSLRKLADRSIEHMGLSRGQAKKAYVFAERPKAGGDPKTDIVIDGKKISVKLPGGVQWASGEARSTLDAVSPWIDDYLNKKLKESEKAVQKEIEEAWKEAKRGLGKTIGKRFVSADKEKRDAALSAQAQRRGKNPDEYIKKAEELIAKKVLEATWEEWNKSKHELVNSFVKAVTTDDELFKNIAYEFITGARQFSSEPEMVAEYILSPDGFYDVSSKEKAAKYLDKMKSGVSLDLRGKGRDYAAKAVVARIDVQADRVYKNEMIKNLSDDLGINPDELALSEPDIYKRMTYELPEEKENH
jgi:hypothetical protein